MAAAAELQHAKSMLQQEFDPLSKALLRALATGTPESQSTDGVSDVVVQVRLCSTLDTD